MAATAGGGRRRTQSNTTEDNALNMIAREAEARLAAKRAARAEARSIRMKELERKQREADESMDKEYQRSLLNEEAIKKRIQSHLTTTTTTTPTTVPVVAPPESEINGPVVSENQLRSLQDNVQDLEQKYRSTMVNIAQLDNERQALSYQVDCLKERLEDEEEVAENLRVELAQRCKEYNKLSYENKKNLEELERLHLMLAERDRILEEHNINIEEELMGVTTTDGPDGLSPRTNESVNMNESVEIDHSGSSGGGKSRGSSRRSSAPDDKEILLEQIRSLKEEVSELRRENDTETTRMKDVVVEEIRPSSWEPSAREGGQSQTNDLEGSTFVDVTEEAEGIDDQQPDAGSVINNNEKNEDFEVIDHNLQAAGGISNFEDKSFEGVSTTSVTTESLDSLEATESIDSEVPLEISVGVSNEADDIVVTIEDHGRDVVRRTSKDSTKDYPDYDIVEDSEVKVPADNQQGERVRSRYFSFPQEEDDGFETPPENEDELLKITTTQNYPDELPEESSGQNAADVQGNLEPKKQEHGDTETSPDQSLEGLVPQTMLGNIAVDVAEGSRSELHVTEALADGNSNEEVALSEKIEEAAKEQDDIGSETTTAENEVASAEVVGRTTEGSEEPAQMDTRVSGEVVEPEVFTTGDLTESESDTHGMDVDNRGQSSDKNVDVEVHSLDEETSNSVDVCTNVDARVTETAGSEGHGEGLNIEPEQDFSKSSDRVDQTDKAVVELEHGTAYEADPFLETPEQEVEESTNVSEIPQEEVSSKEASSEICIDKPTLGGPEKISEDEKEVPVPVDISSDEKLDMPVCGEKPGSDSVSAQNGAGNSEVEGIAVDSGDIQEVTPVPKERKKKKNKKLNNGNGGSLEEPDEKKGSAEVVRVPVIEKPEEDEPTSEGTQQDVPTLTISSEDVDDVITSSEVDVVAAKNLEDEGGDPEQESLAAGEADEEDTISLDAASTEGMAKDDEGSDHSSSDMKEKKRKSRKSKKEQKKEGCKNQ